jgi:hypothetical protein
LVFRETSGFCENQLNVNIMNKENLCCLVANEALTGLTLKKIDELSDELEIDLDKEIWIATDGSQTRIGKYEPCFTKAIPDIRLVFDRTNFDHLRVALDVASDFHR